MNKKSEIQPDLSAADLTTALTPVRTTEATDQSGHESLGHAALLPREPLSPAVPAWPTGPVANSQPPAQPKVDPFLKSRVESLRRKLRSDTFLNSLSLERAFQLMDWMSETEDLVDVLNRIKAKPPQGFGIEVSISTLRRLKATWRAENLSYSLESMMDTITDLEDQSEHDQTERIQKVIGTLLHEKAFELACSQPGSVVLKDVLTSIEKLFALEYKRQKLVHEREMHLRQQSAPIPAAPSAPPAPRHHRVDLHVISSPGHPLLPPAS